MSKLIFRPIKESDLQEVFELAKEAGIGLTTLPADKKALLERIEHSVESFKKKLSQPVNECYFFVLEDFENKKIVGTSAIESAVGYDLPFFSYALSKKTHICHDLNLRVEFELLNCVNDLHGYSELATLFLSPSYRKNHNGLFLSKARFLFMGQFQSRFAEQVIAEMRGVSDEKGNSPFWESVGKKFFQISFDKADKLSTLTNKQFIADLMPVHPIYVNMLSREAREVIGQPHVSTIPAMKILEREGFKKENYVDIFDAGPTILAKLKDIKSIRDGLRVTVSSVSESVHADVCFVSNEQLDFKASIGPVMFTDKGAIVSKEMADLLEVETGSMIRIIPPKWQQSSQFKDLK